MMEKIIYTLLTAVVFSFSGNAQGSYESGMTEALNLWEENKSEEAIDRFEKIGETEKNRWLPFYYAAEIKVIDAFEMTDAQKKEQQLEEAKSLLEKARAIDNADGVELMVLEAMLHTGYITINPMQYGPSLSPVIAGILNKAAQQEPENPRVALFLAEWNIGSAPFMGQDPKSYCEDVRASLPLFEVDQQEEAFAPEWGEERARTLLAQLCEEVNRD